MPEVTYERRDELAMIAAARKDLAFRKNVQPQSIEIVEIEKAVWPDTCLGGPKQSNCDVKGDASEYRILFETSGLGYEYHTGEKYYAISIEQQIAFAAGGGQTHTSRMTMNTYKSKTSRLSP